MEVRTRYAPSPTGFMHVGNLRTALYEYLIAKSQGGKFILRIEDTDQERLVDGAVEVIYRTLDMVGLNHDERPEEGAEYGPYLQTQRKDKNKPYPQQHQKQRKAKYCPKRGGTPSTRSRASAAVTTATAGICPRKR